MNEYDAFEEALERALGSAVRGSEGVGKEVWAALANITWRRKDGEDVEYSFRSGGDVVAELAGEGDYLDWYGCAQEGVVSERVSQAMEKEGWTWDAS